jgi:hypothetical protein
MHLLALTLLLLAAPAVAGEPSVINLSCDGEVTNGADQEPVKKVGSILNLAQRGCPFGGYPGFRLAA